MAVTHRDCSAQNSIVANKMDRTVDTNYLLPFVTLSQSSNTQTPEMAQGWMSSPACSQGGNPLPAVWDREQQTCPTLMKARVTSSPLAISHLKRSLLAAHKSEFFMKHT